MRPRVSRSRQSGMNALKGGIRVDRAPIEFYRVIVHYANGRSEEVDVRQRIPAGGQTRAIDLRGDERAIDSVQFFYLLFPIFNPPSSAAAFFSHRIGLLILTPYMLM